MLSDRIDDIHASLRTGQNPVIADAEEGRLFLRTLVRDYASFRRLVEDNGLRLDKKGWISADLYPITIEILNREPSPGNRVYVGHGQYKICVVYYGVSPELENFVVTCLWPKDSQSSKLAYGKIHGIVSSTEDQDRVVKFGHDFGLEPPNLIHPFNDRSVETMKKPKSVYEWQSIPYISEIGNTLLGHGSPLNFQKVIVETNAGPIGKYVNVKSSIGALLEIRNDGAIVRIPSLFWGNLDFRARVTRDVFSQLKNVTKQSILHILVQEFAEENITRVITKISKGSPIEVASTLMLFSAYLLFLGSRRLKVLSLQQFERLFKACMNRTLEFSFQSDPGLDTWTPDALFETYLSSFFRRIGHEFYYVPYFLSSLPDDVLQLFDSRLLSNEANLSEGPIFGKNGAWLNRAILGRQYQMLRFLLSGKRFISWSDRHEVLYQTLRHLLY